MPYRMTYCLLLFAIFSTALTSSFTTTLAQDDDLTVENIELITRVDAFGTESAVLTGMLHNESDDAYENIVIYADVLDDEAVIGEAFGYLTNQCGAAYTDLALQPGAARYFEVTIDLFEEGDPTDYDFFIEGDASEPETSGDDLALTSITQVTDQEVVLVEWEDETSLRYGVGCDEQVFTTYDWYRYDINADEIVPLEESPNEQYITEAMLRQTGINQVTQSREEDPQLFFRSHLTFPTQSQRIIYQTDLHNIITSERDGSFKRVVNSNLYQYSLQGFVWSPLGNFAAYYFGAYGDPVHYFTASIEGGAISGPLQNQDPSITVPGLTYDGQRVIITGTYPNAQGEDVTGYYFRSTINGSLEFMFEAEEDEIPGNNYPAPTYYRQDADTRFIYIVRPLDGQTVLQCFYREEADLSTLTELPLQLAIDERAWSILSPEATTLALVANGRHAGLWLIDLTSFEQCQ